MTTMLTTPEKLAILIGSIACLVAGLAWGYAFSVI